MLNPRWGKSDKDKFEKSVHGLRSKVSRKYKGKKFIHLHSFNDGDFQYYVFHRQKNQKVELTFAKNTPLTGKSDLFLRFRKDGSFMDIKCNDISLRALIVSHIGKTCGKRVFYEDSKPIDDEVNKKVKNLLTQIPERIDPDFYVEQASIKKTSITPRVAVKVGKKKGPDIRTVLNALDEQNICDLSDKSNISSFHVNFEGTSVGVQIKFDNDGAYKFELSKHYIPEKKINEIKRRIKEMWGIEIGALYTPRLSVEEKKILFDKLLSFDGREPLTEEKRSFLEKMEKSSIISTKSEKIWKCEDDGKHIFDRKYNECSDCGGSLYEYRQYSRTYLNYLGVKQYIRSVLVKRYGKNNVRDKGRKHRKKNYEFFSS